MMIRDGGLLFGPPCISVIQWMVVEAVSGGLGLRLAFGLDLVFGSYCHSLR